MKVRQSLSALALGLGLMLTLLFLLRPAPPAHADRAVYYVSASASGDCLSPSTPCGRVQEALALATDPGDQVWVASGIYTENLSITHSVILRGSWDASFSTQSPDLAPTILDGGGSHNVRVEDAPQARVVLDGLTLRNGRDGIHIWTSAVTVTRCSIQGVVKQGVEIDGGRVLISATRILTAQQGIEVDAGVVRVRDTHIAHTTQEGLLIEGGGTVTFTGNTIEDCGQQGIQVDKGLVHLGDNLLRDIHADGVRVESGDVTLVGNRLYNLDSDGLDISGTQTISGNLIVGAGRRGIYAHDGQLTIIANTVHNAAGDGIRTADGTTVLAARNVISQSGNDGLDLRGFTVTADGNRVVSCADNGLRAEASAAVRLTANQVFSAGVGLAVRGGSRFTLTNNIVAAPLTGCVELGSVPAGHLLHNTLVGNKDSGGPGGIGINILTPMTVTLMNNIVASHTVAISAAVGSAVEARYTLWWGNDDQPPGGTVLLLPPKFVAPGRLDYHLRPTSPAIDAGGPAGVPVDVDGDPRPIGPAPDLGADEVWRFIYLPLVVRGD